MVPLKLQNPAIKAIEGLISVARFRALRGCEPAVLAEILDNISYLPLLLLDDQDRTADVVESLRRMVEVIPEAQLVMREFEEHLGQ